MTLPSGLDIRPLLDVRSQLEIVHHIPGRIRLRLSAGIWTQVKANSDGLIRFLNNKYVIKDYRINPAAATLVIEYDQNRITPQDWDVMMSGGEHDVQQLLNRWLIHFSGS